ncbi:MAG TPA: hypothetical protein EYP52_04755, partial [Anaerolineae bacterium]|nr:hypothetical protein [Anaerolineae bacterium]
MNGYMGRLLWVDLTERRMWDEPLSGEWARQFAGGSGLAARILYEMVDGHTDPLGPESP